MKNKLLSLLLAAAMVCGLLPQPSLADEILTSGICGDQLNWTLTWDGVLTISGEGHMYDFEQYYDDPMMYGYYYGEHEPIAMQYRDSIHSIVVESGVADIGDYAFYNFYNVTSVDLPESVTSIGAGAFNSCASLEKIDLPGQLQYIGMEAFYFCSSLTGIVVPDSVEALYSNTFNSCSSMSTAVIGNGVKTIGTHAFGSCSSLRSVSLGSSLTTIEGNAFRYCEKLETITIPAGVSTLNASAFGYCKGLTSIEVEDGNTSYKSVDGVVLTRDGSKIMVYPASKAGTTYTLPEGVTEIGNYAFCCASGLKQISLDGIAQIGEYAFYESEIKNVVVPDCVTKIGTYAFSNCKQLTSAEIGDGLNELPGNLFNKCSALERVKTGANIIKINSNAFSNCSALTSVQLGKKIETIGANAFQNCKNLSGITLPVAIKALSYNAFYGCAALTDVIYEGEYGDWMAVSVEPGNDPITSAMVKRFGEISGVSGGFAWHLKDGDLLITGRGPMQYYNNYSNIAPWRAYATSINHATLSQGITTVGNYTFYECGNMTRVDLPQSLTQIGGYAFSHCKMLPGIDLPESLNAIGNQAFYNCTGLKTIIIPQGVTELTEYCFESCSALENVTLPNTLKSIRKSAFRGCGKLEHISIPASVTTIENGAFSHCEALKDIVIPAGVSEIQPAVFTYCSSLETITFPVSVTRIELSAFQESYNIQSIFYEGTQSQWNSIDFREPYYDYHEYYGNYGSFREATVYFESSSRFGTCGESLSWSLSSDGVLTISGTGAMEDFASGQAPWVSSVNDITQIVLNAGITHIGSYAFENCRNVTQIKLPSSIADIAEGAFSGCDGLLEFTYEASRTDWAAVSIGNGNDPLLSAHLICAVPEPIRGLVVTPDITYIQLSWTIAEAVDTQIYRVYRRAYDDQGYTLIKEINGRDNLNYSDEGLVPGEIYYYYVVGVSNVGYESPISDIVSASLVPDTMPPQVTKIVPANGSYLSGRVTFTLTAEDNVGVSGGKLWYSVDDGESWTLFSDPQSANLTAELDTAALSDGELRVKATALDASGNESDPLNYIYMVDNTGPVQVTGLWYESTDVTITLHWDEAPDEDIQFFRVERLRADGSYEFALDSAKIGANLTGLTPDTEYAYRVVGYDLHGNRGTVSEGISARTLPDTFAPNVTSIRPTSNWFADRINLSVTAEDEYTVAALTIQVSTDGSAWTDLLRREYDDVAPIRTLAHTLALDDYAEGYLYVRAVAEDAAGNESDTGITAPYVQYVVDRTPPAAPVEVVAEGSELNIEIRWRQGEENDLNAYSVSRATSAEGPYTLIASNLKKLNYIDNTAEDNTTYYYVVTVNDRAGNVSLPSEAVSAVVIPDVTPPEVTAVSPSSGSTLGMGYRTVTAAAIDRVRLDSLAFDYSRDAQNWQSISTRSLYGNSDTANITVPLDEFADGDELYIRVTARDRTGNLSEPVIVRYRVDLSAPEATDARAEFDEAEDAVIVYWTGAMEADLVGYRVYRKADRDSGFTLVGSRAAVAGQAEYVFIDRSASRSATQYVYQVETMDSTGNTANFTTQSVTLPDRTLPTPVIACDMVMGVNIEYYIDGSGSYDNTGITAYAFDFGDGTTADTARPIHRYTQAGTYTITLTVTDRDGHEASTSVEVLVENPATIGTVTITVVDENGAPVSNAPVYFDLGEPEQYVKPTDGRGKTRFTANAGRHVVGCVIPDNNWLPVKKSVIVVSGEETDLRMTLVHQTMIEGHFEIRKMTLEEIRTAGIDITKPENQHTVEITLHLTYGTVSKDTSFYYNPFVDDPTPPIIIDVDSSGGGGGGGGGGSGKRVIIPDVIWDGYGSPENAAIAVLDVPIGVFALKDFYDVRLHIIYNAGREFSMLDNTVTLNVPDGLTIVDTFYSEAENQVAIREIPGQTTQTLYWVLRGDRIGSYLLSADYSGILKEFNERVSTRFEATEPIEVTGLSNVTMKVEYCADIDNGAYYDNNQFFFNTILANEGDTPIDALQITTDRDAYTLTNAYLVDHSRWGRWLDNMQYNMYAELYTNKLHKLNGIDQLPIDEDNNVAILPEEKLEPGYTLICQYSSEPIETSQENAKWQLIEAVAEYGDTYGMKLEFAERPWRWFIQDVDFIYLDSDGRRTRHLIKLQDHSGNEGILFEPLPVPVGTGGSFAGWKTGDGYIANRYTHIKGREVLEAIWGSDDLFIGSRDGWPIVNTFESFGYTQGTELDLMRNFTRVFGVRLSSLQYNSSIRKSFNGYCFGTALLAAMQYAKDVDLKEYFHNDGNTLHEFGYNSVTSDDEGNNILSVGGNTDVIEKIEDAYITQFSAQYAESNLDFGDNYADLIDRLNNSSNGSYPMLVSIRSPELKHALLTEPTLKPIPIDDYGTRYRIYLYDPNHPITPKNLVKPSIFYGYAPSTYIDLDITDGRFEYHDIGGHRMNAVRGRLGKELTFVDTGKLSNAYKEDRLSLYKGLMGAADTVFSLFLKPVLYLKILDAKLRPLVTIQNSVVTVHDNACDYYSAGVTGDEAEETLIVNIPYSRFICELETGNEILMINDGMSASLSADGQAKFTIDGESRTINVRAEDRVNVEGVLQVNEGESYRAYTVGAALEKASMELMPDRVIAPEDVSIHFAMEDGETEQVWQSEGMSLSELDFQGIVGEVRYKLDMTRIDDDVICEVNGGTGQVLIAFYDQNDRMLSIAQAGTRAIDAGAAVARGFYVDENFKPLCDSVELALE